MSTSHNISNSKTILKKKAYKFFWRSASKWAIKLNFDKTKTRAKILEGVPHRMKRAWSLLQFFLTLYFDPHKK
jgi:hypothetical protein